jgi:hypothetical protein
MSNPIQYIMVATRIKITCPSKTTLIEYKTL